MGERGRLDLTTLTPQQLQGFKEQVDGEVQSMMQSLQTMQDVSRQFSMSEQAIGALKTQEPGKPVLLPLTNSLYVAGELEDPSKVLIDVGTGYYVEKSCQEGEEFCKRKCGMLKVNSENLLKLVREKQDITNQVQRVLQMKMAQQQQQQQEAT